MINVYNFLIKNFLGMRKTLSQKEATKWFRNLNAQSPGLLFATYRCDKEKIGDSIYYTIHPKRLKSQKVILYLHGGGYFGGPHLVMWLFVKKLVNRLGCRVIMFNYKLAPAHVHPTQLNETRALYRHLLSRYQSSDLIFMGDSAGGGLALGTALKLKSEGLPLPSKLVLISPVLEVTLSNPDIGKVKTSKFLDWKTIQALGKVYAGETATDDPFLSPLHGDLEGISPIQILVGEAEIMFPDCELFHEKAKKCGVAIDYHKAPGMFHDWILFPVLREAEIAFLALEKFVKDEE